MRLHAISAALPYCACLLVHTHVAGERGGGLAPPRLALLARRQPGAQTGGDWHDAALQRPRQRRLGAGAQRRQRQGRLEGERPLVLLRCSLRVGTVGGNGTLDAANGKVMRKAWSPSVCLAGSGLRMALGDSNGRAPPCAAPVHARGLRCCLALAMTGGLPHPLPQPTAWLPCCLPRPHVRLLKCDASHHLRPPPVDLLPPRPVCRSAVRRTNLLACLLSLAPRSLAVQCVVPRVRHHHAVAHH